MTFAQQNEPVYTERLDSVTEDGNLIRKVDYADNGDFTYRHYDEDRLLVSMNKYNKYKKCLSQYYDFSINGELCPYTKDEYEYDSDGNLTKSVSVMYKFPWLDNYIIEVIEKNVDEVSKCIVEYTKHFTPDSVLYQVVKSEYDEKGRLLNRLCQSVDEHGNFTLFEGQTMTYTASGEMKTAEFDYGSQQQILEYIYDKDDKLDVWNTYLQVGGEKMLKGYHIYDENGYYCIEEKNEKGVVNKYHYTYDSNGRLSEYIECVMVGEDEIKTKKVVFTDMTMFDGRPYCVSEHFVTEDNGDTWLPTARYIQFPKKLINGKTNEDYHNLGPTDILQIRYDYLNENDYDLYDIDIVDGNPVYTSKSSYRYNSKGDRICYEFYKFEDNNFVLDSRDSYFYDENTLCSTIAGYNGYYYKLLYIVSTDGSGNETYRTTYHYSPYTTTGITSVASSSDKAQAIYNLNGQKVSSTQSGQIYIQNGKKFIAK